MFDLLASDEVLAGAVVAFAATAFLFGQVFFTTSDHRKTSLPKVGRKIPPPRGAHLDTQPITLPVTSIISVPAPATRLVQEDPPPRPDIAWAELVAARGPVTVDLSRRSVRHRSVA